MTLTLRLSSVLSGYFARHFLLGVAILLGILLTLILVFDTIELLRRAANKPDIGIDIILGMAFLHLPHLGQQMVPFATLFGAMLTFWRLNRARELVVTRAAGVSPWQILTPAIGLAALIGIVAVAIINPVASAMLTRFDQMETRYLKGQASLVAVSSSGLWLRQASDDGRWVIHGESVKPTAAGVRIDAVTVFEFNMANEFTRRIEATHATLAEGFWILSDAIVYVPEEDPQTMATLKEPTDLTPDRIQDSFAPPESLSFWSLPDFIDTLDEAGFSATRHRLHFHSLLATPLLLVAMVLIAAAFTLRSNQRRGGTALIIAGGGDDGISFLLLFRPRIRIWPV
ncbi:MAG: LptF/LptG family permease [Magnetospiraceae bacterium]